MSEPSNRDFLNPDADPFHPPVVPTEVGCLHCGQEYDSYLIEWRVMTDSNGKPCGFWCCPTPDCDGKGFGFDILPTDPTYRDERGGWVQDDYDEEDECTEGFNEESFGDKSQPQNGSTNGKHPLDGEDEIPF